MPRRVRLASFSISSQPASVIGARSRKRWFFISRPPAWPLALLDRRLPMPRLPSLLGPPSSASPPPSSMVASMPVIGPSVNRKVLRCCDKVGSLRRSHSSAIAACSFSSSRLCSRMARSSGLLVALARWLYQSTASSSSISETMARCWSMTSGPSLPASSCSASLDMRSPSILRANTSPTGWSGKRRRSRAVPIAERQRNGSKITRSPMRRPWLMSSVSNCSQPSACAAATMALSQSEKPCA